MNFLNRRFIPWHRKGVQAAYAAFCLFTGWQFYKFYLWATGNGASVPRPPAVEAFLPISALMSLKRLVITGNWDLIHPAGLTIFIAILASSLIFRRGFCGWVCPVGLLSDLLEKTGRFTGIGIHMPGPVRYPMLLIKYLLLGFFAWIILVRMDTRSIESFLQAPYNITVDARMLMFFLEPSVMASGVMIGLAGLSVILKHYWCTYCCPYGALLGLIALVSPFHVRRNSEKCKNCHACQDACPADIKIWAKNTVRDPECIGCMECVSKCPEDRCLELSVPGTERGIYWWIIPVGTVAVITAAWLIASLTGHWHSSIPDEAFKVLYTRFLRL